MIAFESFILCCREFYFIEENGNRQEVTSGEFDNRLIVTRNAHRRVSFHADHIGWLSVYQTN